MDIKDINTDNPQSFQLATVQAITAMGGEIKRLAELVTMQNEHMVSLEAELTRRDETYVTITDHVRDVKDCYKMIDDGRKDADRKIAELSLELKDRIIVGDAAHADLKKTGKAKAILWSAVTLVFTFLVMYVIEDLTKGK